MKYFFFFLLCMVSLPALSQAVVSVKWLQYEPAAGSDTVYYAPEKKITWADFKGTPEPGSDATAITSSGFGYMAGIKYKDGKVNISITVYCYFSRHGSWVIKGKETAYALNHEQHHFDVSYIVANLFVQKLKTAKFTWDNYNELLDKFYNDSRQQLKDMQNEYDGQTKNGRLPAVQEKWNAKIDKQLAQL